MSTNNITLKVIIKQLFNRFSFFKKPITKLRVTIQIDFPKPECLIGLNGSTLISVKQGLGFKFCGWKKLVLEELYPIVGQLSSNQISRSLVDFQILVVHTKIDVPNPQKIKIIYIYIYIYIYEKGQKPHFGS